MTMPRDLKIYRGLKANLAMIRNNADQLSRQDIVGFIDSSKVLSRDTRDTTLRDDIAYLTRAIHNIHLGVAPQDVPKVFHNYRQAGEYMSFGRDFGYIQKEEVIGFCTGVESAILRATGQEPRFL